MRWVRNNIHFLQYTFFWPRGFTWLHLIYLWSLLTSLTKDYKSLLASCATNTWSLSHEILGKIWIRMHHSWKNYLRYDLKEQIDNNVHLFFTRAVKEWYIKKIIYVLDDFALMYGQNNWIYSHIPFPITATSPLCLFFFSSMNQIAVTIKRNRNSFEVLLKQLRRGKII